MLASFHADSVIGLDWRDAPLRMPSGLNNVPSLLERAQRKCVPKVCTQSASFESVCGRATISASLETRSSMSG
jgi:hypothetical protein